MRGHTLVELIFVLLLLGVTAASVVPTARRARDGAAVAAARETVVGLIAEARQAAVASGSASVRLSQATATVEALASAAVLRSVHLGAELGVSLSLSGARREVELRYDALGLGRLASQTVVFRRGQASAVLVVSAYGRVTRR